MSYSAGKLVITGDAFFDTSGSSTANFEAANVIVNGNLSANVITAETLDWTNLAVTGTLSVSGATTVGSTLDVSGNLTASNLKDVNFNTSVGLSSMTSLTLGSYNTNVGEQGLQRLTTGTANVNVGQGGLQFLTTGLGNISLGAIGMPGLTTGFDNISMQFNGPIGLSTGSNNVLVGANAGDNITSAGTNNVCIGVNSTFPLGGIGLYNTNPLDPSGNAFFNIIDTYIAQGISFDTSGYIYTVDIQLLKVSKYNSSGVKQPYNSPLLTNLTISGLTVDSNFNIYISDGGSNKIYKINQYGDNLLTVFTSAPGAQSELFGGIPNILYGVTSDTSNNVYAIFISGSGLSVLGSIIKYNSSGAKVWCTHAGPPGAPYYGSGIQTPTHAHISNGKLWVANYNNATGTSQGIYGNIVSLNLLTGANIDYGAPIGGAPLYAPVQIFVDTSNHAYISYVTNNITGYNSITDVITNGTSATKITSGFPLVCQSPGGMNFNDQTGVIYIVNRAYSPPGSSFTTTNNTVVLGNPSITNTFIYGNNLHLDSVPVGGSVAGNINHSIPVVINNVTYYLACSLIAP